MFVCAADDVEHLRTHGLTDDAYRRIGSNLIEALAVGRPLADD